MTEFNRRDEPKFSTPVVLKIFVPKGKHLPSKVAQEKEQKFPYIKKKET